MKKHYVVVGLLLIVILINIGCKQKTGSPDFSVPGYNPLVSAFTSGLISAESAVRIRFAESFADSVVPYSTLDNGAINFTPKVTGTLYYIDQQTIEFRPEERFKQGTAYTAELKLTKLFPNAQGEKSFAFRFHTIEQHLTIDFGGFSPYDDYKPVLNFLSAVIQTTDVADQDLIQAVIDVQQNGKQLPVTWDNSPDGKIHRFTIDSIVRGENELIVEVGYNGASISSSQSGVKEFKVPALGDFKVIHTNLIQHPQQHILVSFSDPIRKNQSLDGLIRLSNDTDCRFIIDGNIVKVYPNVRQNGTLTLFVEPGIRNTAGKGLKSGERYDIVFDEIKPAVEFIGEGVIVPSTDEVLLPFKAVNLRAVDIKVVRIYENNIAQFLQVNDISGERELKRAGRLIVKKSIDLIADKPIDYGQWNTFSINLTELIKAEPGAIYRIEMNFRQSQSLYSCAEEVDYSDESEENGDFDRPEDEDMSYWDSYEDYYSDWDYYYYDGYNWEDREDPCKKAYYGTRRAIAKNILASNLGLIAKAGSGEQLNVTVTSLLQAKPVSGATVTLYNYQQQKLVEGVTDGNGMIQLSTKAKPFLIVAHHQGQKGYLRLIDGAALSYSMFDVAGSVVNNGIKGFIYGERGVWRPGDSIFLNLIVDDHLNPIPDNHPVIFELRDPMGKVVQKSISAGSETGFFTFFTKTAASDPTGRYTVTASVGGAKFSKTIQVETIKPNRLKIALDFEGDTIYPARGAVNATLFGKWLTGATARNLRAEIEVVFKPIATSFKGFADYTFTNPAKSVAQYPSTFWSGSINETGNARFSKNLYIAGEAPGMLNAIFTTRLFEKSGDFSIDQLTIPCSPYNTYVGIKTPPGDKRDMLLTDTLHTVKVVTLSSEGKPETKIGLEVNVYKLSWRWWWDASSESLASYMGSSYQTPVYSTHLSTKNGHGTFDFKIDYPEWGRYLIMVTDKGGHSAATVVYVDWPGWAGRANKGDPDAASVLTFSSDKETYTVGETAKITFPSSGSGKILVSLENGTGILRQEWVDTEGTETNYSLKITPEMSPNIYLFASLIQPHKNRENDLPVRMFGVIPIRVEDPQTKLYPEISMPDELSPNSTFQVKVSEKHNKKMTYTIAVVDEGLLDLTRFKTPDPWSYFYAKEALGVKTWDMFEHVLGAYGGRIDGIYNIGGGMDESGQGAKDANRFPPMVRFIGPFTYSGKTNVHTLEVPNYIGSVRTMLISGNKEAYGFTEKTTPVKQPLMVLATLPRVLGPGEEVALPVNVFVMDEKIRNVDIKLSTNDMLIPVTSEKRIVFDGTGDQIIDFMLKTPEKTGTGKVKIIATSGKHSAEYEVELLIRSSNPPVTNYTVTALEASDTYTRELEYVGMPGTNQLLLEVSAIPPIDFGRRMKYLLEYPHGCIEQITSSAFPQLFLGDVVELSEQLKTKTAINIKAAIKQMASFQLSGGGFTYWPGSIKESSWGTSYAGHFLLEAKAKGYDIPESMLSNWQRYQKKEARRWSLSGSVNSYEINQEQILQAYRLFTLALSGEAEIGSMNRLRERTDLIPEAKWRLAAAYALAGQTETARDLITNVSTEVSDYYDSGYTFGSSTRDRAMILEAMILIGMKENGVLLLEEISKQLSSQAWMNTQTTAYSLIAVAKYAGGNTPGNPVSFDYSFDGVDMKRAETGLPIAQISFEPGDNLKGTVKVKNNSSGILFVRVVNTGVPKPGEEQSLQKNLILNVQYTDMEGNRLDPGNIKHGADFKAVYTVANPGMMGHYENVAITTIFPSGWEIHNERLLGSANPEERITYKDLRDDRVMTYLSLASGRSKSFSIRLNAAYRGNFYLPSIKAEEMYKNDVQVVVPGEWIKIETQE